MIILPRQARDKHRESTQKKRCIFLQTSLVEAKKQLATAEPPGRIWQANSSTPHFFYRDENKTLHRVDYDDSESLVAKYKYAKSVAARGTGMWTASSLDYEGDPEMGKTFWTDLKDFQ